MSTRAREKEGRQRRRKKCVPPGPSSEEAPHALVRPCMVHEGEGERMSLLYWPCPEERSNDMRGHTKTRACQEIKKEKKKEKERASKGGATNWPGRVGVLMRWQTGADHKLGGPSQVGKRRRIIPRTCAPTMREPRQQRVQQL